ncbi:E3 ubiquitin-protein ligase RNF4 isoform X1 [Equus przewalskii]|uniref:E3 ubiquitin-protein ligase RNF4 isoform X1 n=2 Tax=Equus przewalskii TaxID=9798 RepID=A0ABM4P290_EQUPR
MSTRKRRGGTVNSRQAQKRTREAASTPEMALEAEPIELVESAGDEIVDLTCESLEPVVVDLTHNDSVVRTKSTANVASKRPRRVIDLETKLKLIKDYEGGKSVMVIARQSGMSHSTIATILKNKNKVMEAVKGSASLKATRLTKIREGPISDMEKLLMTWIEDQVHKRIPLSTMMITAKAKSLFAMLKEKAGPDYDVEFTASSGWFKRFKNRYSLHNVKMSGESASTDVKAGEELRETLELVPEEMAKEELELEQKRIAEEEVREKETVGEEEEESPRKFTVKGLAEAFTDLSKLLKKFEDMDPNTERFLLIERNVHSALSAYKQIYDEKKKQTKQTTVDIFLKRVTPPQEEPQAGPSGGVPAEGPVITGEDSSMRVTAPEDFPQWDKM